MIPPIMAPTFGLLLSAAAPTGGGEVLLLSGPAGGTIVGAAEGATDTTGAELTTGGAIGDPAPL
jgi:hypothetical protein